MRMVCLEEIAESIVDGPFGSSLKTCDYVETGIPVLQGKNITGDEFAWKEIRYISHRKARELFRSSVVVGDHLIIKIGSIGYSAILDDLEGCEYGIIPANLARIRPNRDVVDDRYLHQWLTSEGAKRYFKGVASKTAQPALSLSKIKAAEIPLPPLEEQKRIAAILDQADSLRRLRQRAIDRLNTLGQAIFYEMFGDTSEARYPVEPLDDVADTIDYGFTASATEEAIGPKFLRITDIQDGKVDWGAVPYCEATQSDISAKRLLAGDIVFARTGATTGKSFLIKTCPTDSIFASYLIRVRPSKKLLPEFVSSFFQTPDYWRQISLQANGAAQPGVNSKKLKELLLPVPTLGEQEKFRELYNSVCNNRGLLEDDLVNRNALFSALQHRAFRGEL